MDHLRSYVGQATEDGIAGALPGCPPQQPLQMLNLPSTGLLRARAGARAEERRDSLRDTVAARRLILTRGLTAGATRVETIGAAEGTAGVEMVGGGGAGILAALPMPLGSLAELFRPPALPGPRIPLTPASCAKDFALADRLAATARTRNADLPNMTTLPWQDLNGSTGVAFRIRASRLMALNAALGGFRFRRGRRYLMLACAGGWRSGIEFVDASASAQACGLTRSPGANF